MTQAGSDNTSTTGTARHGFGVDVGGTVREGRRSLRLGRLRCRRTSAAARRGQPRVVESFGRRVAYAVRRIPDEISPYGRSECPSGAKRYAMSFSGHHFGTGSRDMSIIFHW